MIIGIDARVLLDGTGGIFVYAKNLLSTLIPLARHHQIKLFVNRHRKQETDVLTSFLKYPNVKLYRYRFPNKFLNTAFKFATWPRIDKLLGGCDALFFPAMLYGAWSPEVKTVLTMHDLSFLMFPEFFTYRQRLWHQLVSPSGLCRRAARVIAVSENTRQDLLRYYRLSPESVATIHSGLDPVFQPLSDALYLSSLRERYNLPNKKFILQVGTIEPRKNGLATLAAFSHWRQEHPVEAEGYDLIFAGHQGWKAREFWRTLKRDGSRRGRVHIIHNPPPSDLPGLYNLASIFIYPSFYEGFGFPPLEAMGCGLPVIASSSSSLGEIVGEAGLLIDPYRIDDIVEAMRALVNDVNLAETLRVRGLARAAEFSWEKTARETLMVLENV